MSGGRSSRDSGLDIIKAFAIVLVPLEHAHAPFFAKNRPLWEHVVGNAASAVTPMKSAGASCNIPRSQPW